MLAGANRRDSLLLAPDPGPVGQPGTAARRHHRAHGRPGYDSDKTRAQLDERGLHGRIAHKGEKAPIHASQRWHVERTHAWQNTFHRLAHCYERRATVINAFFNLADPITVRSVQPGGKTWLVT